MALADPVAPRPAAARSARAYGVLPPAGARPPAPPPPPRPPARRRRVRAARHRVGRARGRGARTPRPRRRSSPPIRCGSGSPRRRAPPRARASNAGSVSPPSVAARVGQPRAHADATEPRGRPGSSSGSSPLAALLDPQPRRLAGRHERAARVEAAAGRDAGGVGRLAGEDLLLHLLALGHHRQQRARVRVPRARSSSSVGPSSTIRPRYITATRSAMFQASPRSWVTTRIATPVSRTSFEHQREDLAADRGVEARDRLVGHEQARVRAPSRRR